MSLEAAARKCCYKSFWNQKEMWKWKYQLIFYLMQLSEMPGVGRVNISEKLWVSVVKPVEDRLVGGFLNIGSSHGYFSIIV